MDIRQIIHEEVNKLITEGYSGKYAEEWVTNELMPKLTKWFKSVKLGKPNVERKFLISVFTNGHSFFKNCTMVNRRSSYSLTIKFYYFPDKNFYHGVAAKTCTPRSLYDKNIDVIVNFNKDGEIPFVYRTLIHELTHVIDFIIARNKANKNYFGYSHQDDSRLPDCIMMVMYYIWDTSEFNAWQAYVKSDVNLLNEYFEAVMAYLNEANEINDEETWNGVKNYLAEQNPSMINKTAAWIKKYFITTSFNRLKKFIKKVKL